MSPRPRHLESVKSSEFLEGFVSPKSASLPPPPTLNPTLNPASHSKFQIRIANQNLDRDLIP